MTRAEQPIDLSRRFDAAEAWARLSPPVRDAIGAAVLSGLAASRLVIHAMDEDDLRLSRVGIAAEVAAADALDRVMAEIALSALVPDLPSGDPPVPALLGMVCERCGCTERDACPAGCGWAREDLCTACVPPPAVSAR